MSHLMCVFTTLLILCMVIGSIWCGLTGAWWGVAWAIGITAALVWLMGAT